MPLLRKLYKLMPAIRNIQLLGSDIKFTRKQPNIAVRCTGPFGDLWLQNVLGTLLFFLKAARVPHLVHNFIISTHL